MPGDKDPPRHRASLEAGACRSRGGGEDWQGDLVSERRARQADLAHGHNDGASSGRAVPEGVTVHGFNLPDWCGEQACRVNCRASRMCRQRPECLYAQTLDGGETDERWADFVRRESRVTSGGSPRTRKRIARDRFSALYAIARDRAAVARLH